jgi:hypothetical protein
MIESASSMLSGGQVRQADEQHKSGRSPLEKLAAGQIKPNGKHDEFLSPRSTKQPGRAKSTGLRNPKCGLMT